MAIEKGLTAQALDRWVEVIKEAVPQATVGIHWGSVDVAALERMCVKLPAIYVAVLSVPSTAEVGDDTQDGSTVFSAFILTGGQRKDLTNLNLSDALQGVVPVVASKVDCVGRASNVTWKPILSGQLVKKTVCVSAVAWRQVIRRGQQSDADEMFTTGVVWPPAVVPENLYVESCGEIQPL